MVHLKQSYKDYAEFRFYHLLVVRQGALLNAGAGSNSKVEYSLPKKARRHIPYRPLNEIASPNSILVEVRGTIPILVSTGISVNNLRLLSVRSQLYRFL